MFFLKELRSKQVYTQPNHSSLAAVKSRVNKQLPLDDDVCFAEHPHFFRFLLSFQDKLMTRHAFRWCAKATTG